ncbi:uncharacterized protein ATNIH1004_000081 [Aspergillus tanneri]|uniref:Uncharacterized protein n=1 Tax=Aspergillus tanneri TaxID=1220188 RepID=A0A5M9N214_9EURO|nr:uncharacterized protein ATNIH1004_000081 [Aspergillus tanneri]KAA8651203.1 hypothetical protein ATNIH1004_000081 [Aspergillus tanneri]
MGGCADQPRSPTIIQHWVLQTLSSNDGLLIAFSALIDFETGCFSSQKPCRALCTPEYARSSSPRQSPLDHLPARLFSRPVGYKRNGRLTRISHHLHILPFVLGHFGTPSSTMVRPRSIQKRVSNSPRSRRQQRARRKDSLFFKSFEYCQEGRWGLSHLVHSPDVLSQKQVESESWRLSNG